MTAKINANVAATQEFLASRGYTIRAAAEEVGISPSHLARVIHGERIPSRALLTRLRKIKQRKGIKPYYRHSRVLANDERAAANC